MSSDPAHVQAERALIGAFLLRPQEFHSVRIKAEQFTDSVCRRVYVAMEELWDEGITPSVIEIADWTEANKGRALDMVEVMDLSNIASLSWEVPRTARIIREAHNDRQIRLIAESIRTSPKRGSQLLAEAMTAFNHIGDQRSKGPVLLTEAVGEFLNEAERRQKGEDTGSEILTGIPEIDRKRPLARGGVLTIAGRTSMGKSTMANFLMDHWAQMGEKILLVSTETQVPMVARRFLARTSELDSREFGYGKDSNDTWKKLTIAASKLHGHPIWIDDESDNASDISKAIRHARQQYGITIVVIDHIHECIPNEDPRKEINQLISSVKSACREEPKIGLVLVAQISRKPEAREDKRPRLPDLKESGTIEEASDAVWLLFRPHYYAEDSKRYKNSDPGELWVKEGKTRDGPTGWFFMSWSQYGQVRGVLEKNRNAADFDFD